MGGQGKHSDVGTKRVRAGDHGVRVGCGVHGVGAQNQGVGGYGWSGGWGYMESDVGRRWGVEKDTNHGWVSGEYWERGYKGAEGEVVDNLVHPHIETWPANLPLANVIVLWTENSYCSGPVTLNPYNVKNKVSIIVYALEDIRIYSG